MKTWDYLTNPVYGGFYWAPILTGLAVAALCSLLSVLVVLKRMAFIGQGISHAAFGGIGVASVLGLLGTMQEAPTPGQSAGQFLVVLGFCLAAGLLIGWLSERGGTEADTAIGIVLVAAMAVGAILILRARSGVSLESFLFGDILAVSWADAAIGWAEKCPAAQWGVVEVRPTATAFVNGGWTV